MKDNALIVLIIGMVIIVALVTPSLMATGADWLSGIKDFINEGFGDFGGNGDNGTFGTGSYSGLVTMTINYADGTSRSIEPNQFALLPLTIYDSGKEVTSITLICKAKLETDGTITSWQLPSLDEPYAYMRAYIYPAGSSSEVDSIFRYSSFEKSGSTWTSGTTKELKTLTVQASDIENFLDSNGAPEGEYRMHWEALVGIDVTFDTGGTDTAKGGTSINWRFNYENAGISSFSISMTYSGT